MEKLNLFLDKDNKWLTNIDLYKILDILGAKECDILFIHTSLSFGTPNRELKRKEILKSIFDVIMALNVKTVCMPTFTFSFCNKSEYNPNISISKMGALNEFFRKQEGVIRSKDPLMSVALIGEDKDLVEGIGHSSCGANSTFDKIRHRDNVKFLFLGPKIGDCFTYMHYLEWLYSVDYRYERIFKGNITIDNKTKSQEYDLFVRYKGVIPNTASYIYEQRMYDKGSAKIITYGNATISIVDEKAASSEYKKCLDENPYFFVDFAEGKLNKDKTFNIEKEMLAL